MVDVMVERATKEWGKQVPGVAEGTQQCFSCTRADGVVGKAALTSAQKHGAVIWGWQADPM